MEIQFIQKKYYTFSELALRWNCEIDDIKQAVIDEVIIPSYFIKNDKSLYELYRLIDDVNGLEMEKMLEKPMQEHGFYYLIFPMRTGVSECMFGYFSEKSSEPKEYDICCGLNTALELADVIQNGVVMANIVDCIEARNLISVERKSTSNPDTGIDPSDLPPELDAANMAYRAVLNGSDKTGTFKNRLMAYLKKNYPDLTEEAIKRIATVANPDKSTGRPKNRL